MRALEELCQKVSQAIAHGCTFMVLSDRGVDLEHTPMPALLATSGVHHYLIRKGTRTTVGLVIETGEAREVHHCAILMGYGAGAINPYLAFETLDDMLAQGGLPDDLTHEKAVKNYIKGLNKGLLKVMSKMGISTIQSYCGAQIFEAVGLNEEFVNEYFTWTASRVGGIGLEVIAEEVLRRHRRAFPDRLIRKPDLDGAGNTSGGRRGRITSSTPTRFSSCSMPADPANTGSSRSTVNW